MRTVLCVLLALTTIPAVAQEPGPPRRLIPPSLLVDLVGVEDRFDLALATDCAAGMCQSKGCSYVAHTLADRPPSASLPGLGNEAGPSSTADAQAWLTQARCEFAYEGSLDAEYVQALSRRLGTRTSGGYTTVSVSGQALPPLPPPVAEPVVEPVPEPEPPPPPPEPSLLRDLWSTLLDDLPWMLGLILGTACATALIWGWRRLGRETIEEKAMLAEIAREGAEPLQADVESTDAPEPPPPPIDENVAVQLAGWRMRVAAIDPLRPDPGLQAMLRDLLRAGELPLLARAVLAFPSLPAAFPAGGDIAASKLALAEYLKTADVAALPSDAELVRALNRHSSSAALASQTDAEVVRSLREEFGAGGLVTLIDGVSARAGALLFALAPPEAQQELVHLLEPGKMAAMAEQLMRSNRMDPAETEYLFAVLRQGPGVDMPTAAPADVSDRGFAFDAAGALSTLLPHLAQEDLAALLGRALDRFGGSLPSWYAEILVPDMLFALDAEARADLLLGADAESMAAWLSLQDSSVTERLLADAPNALRASIRSAPVSPSRARQLATAERGRRDLARDFQAQIARNRMRFEDVVASMAGSR